MFKSKLDFKWTVQSFLRSPITIYEKVLCGLYGHVSAEKKSRIDKGGGWYINHCKRCSRTIIEYEVPTHVNCRCSVEPYYDIPVSYNYDLGSIVGHLSITINTVLTMDSILAPEITSKDGKKYLTGFSIIDRDNLITKKSRKYHYGNVNFKEKVLLEHPEII